MGMFVRVVMLSAVGMLWMDAAEATWMQPDQEVPVERLIENIKDFVTKHPDNAEGYFSLARLYSFAYATGMTKIAIYTNHEPWEPAFYAAHTPSSEAAGSGSVSRERMDYLTQSVRNFHEAIARKADDMLFWLGLGYDCAQAAAHAEQMVWPFTGSAFDEAVKAKLNDRRFWEDQALEAYRKAVVLDTKHYGGVSVPVAAEAGSGILAILTERSNPTESEKKEIRRMKRAVSAMGLQPRAITPIVFSLDDRPLESLLHTGKTVKFDLDGSGRKRRWKWVRPETAFLAWDPLATGRILSGRQLFGSATWWMFWRNGYAALAALDNDGNGWLEGAELNGIAVWQDRNSNGHSDPGEVVQAAALGITGIKVSVTGSVLGMPSASQGIRLTGGRTVATYDWITEGPEKR